MRKPTPIVLALIIINVLIYWASTTNQNHFVESYALYFHENSQYNLWQFLTHMFMHGGIFHLLLNMIALFLFGAAIEHTIGKIRFLILFIGSGIGAAAFFMAINDYQYTATYTGLIQQGLSAKDIALLLEQGRYLPTIMTEQQAIDFYSLYQTPMVGASGAVYGLLVAFAMLFPNIKLMLIFIPFPIAAKYFIPILISIDLISGLTGYSIFGDGIAYFAHVGGAITGCILMLIMYLSIRASARQR